MLTCYSALLYLLFIHSKNHTVHPEDVIYMIGLTPTERLEYLHRQPRLAQAHTSLDKLLVQYELFLGTTNQPEEELINRFMNKTDSAKFMGNAKEFGDSMFEALSQIGESSDFYRLLVV
jgi:hypothetical protein